jgi:hypothetical protein
MSSKPPARQAQLRAEQEKQKKQQQYLLIGGAVVAVVIVLVGAFLLISRPRVATSTGSANCANLQVEADEGRNHLTPGETPMYHVIPPTSGTHNPVPLQQGVYDNNVDVTQLVHSMEHGYVIMYYNNAATTDQINQLIRIQQSDPFKMIVAPYPSMDNKVALVAWDHLQTCDGVNEQAIRSFTAQFRNQGPEQAQ